MALTFTSIVFSPTAKNGLGFRANLHVLGDEASVEVVKMRHNLGFRVFSPTAIHKQ